jgi:nicotinamide riboside transporter PnuC
MELVTKWLNLTLLKEPMNWGVVFLVATVWLLLFHVIMQAFGAMSAGGNGTSAPGSGQALPATSAGVGNFPQLSSSRFAEDTQSVY